MYKNDKELHTQPTSVQFQHSKATRLGPRCSTHPHSVEQTWRNTDRSPRVRVQKSFFQQSPEQQILSKTYPTSGYNLAHISRHAKLSGWWIYLQKSI